MTQAFAGDDLSAPVEDYLKAIYRIEADNGTAGTREIAARLGVSAAAASAMVSRLAAQGLLDHEKYRGVRLTDAGRSAALRTVRRHRVIESYLMSALGYTWDEVHPEAERLEHAASDDLIDRMARAVGEPTTDPHGAPIPTREGRIDQREAVPLGELSPGDAARVGWVRTEEPERLRHLAGLGLVPGAFITVVAREPFGGPITFLCGEARRWLGVDLALEVMVEQAGGED